MVACRPYALWFIVLTSITLSSSTSSSDPPPRNSSTTTTTTTTTTTYQASTQRHALKRMQRGYCWKLLMEARSRWQIPLNKRTKIQAIFFLCLIFKNNTWDNEKVMEIGKWDYHNIIIIICGDIITIISNIITIIISNNTTILIRTNTIGLLRE